MRTAHKEKSAAPVRAPLRKTAGNRRGKRSSVRKAPRGPEIVIEEDAQELIDKEFADQIPVVLTEIPKYFPTASKIFVYSFTELEEGAQPHLVLEISSPADIIPFRRAIADFFEMLRDKNLPIGLRTAILKR